MFKSSYVKNAQWLFQLVWHIFLQVLVPKAQRSWLELDLKKSVSLSVFRFVSLGFASRRNLYICVPAAHPPGGAWGEDSFGEGRQRAGGGAGGPALQYTLPGEQQQGSPKGTQCRDPPLSFVGFLWHHTELCAMRTKIILSKYLRNGVWS